MNYLLQEDAVEFRENLSYMHVDELESQLQELGLSLKGFNKNELIERLVHYAITGKELSSLKIPENSRASRNRKYTIAPQSLMLYGAYKNDRATRDFFQQTIGKYFHFTAQGIDWLREQWLKGNPPTYADFAQEWQAEYERNKKDKRSPKQEWAYIRFTQHYTRSFPHASKKEITLAWNIKRQKAVQKVHDFFKQSI